MAASSNMFVTIMRQSQLSQNEIENYIFEIAQKNSTDDHDVIADMFMRQHGGDVGASTAADDMESSRAEIKNFLRGCTDLEDQRAVRSRKSSGNDGKAAGCIATAAISTNSAATTTAVTTAAFDGGATAVADVNRFPAATFAPQSSVGMFQSLATLLETARTG